MLKYCRGSNHEHVLRQWRIVERPRRRDVARRNSLGISMVDLQPPYRRASPEDAPAMAELANMAGEGLPLYLWTEMATSDESPWDIGRSRAKRETGAFSYRNTVIREEDGEPAACLIGYPLDDEPAPVSYSDMPAMFVPLQELEDLAPGTWYVNVLATYPRYRGRAYGSQLLSIAERIAVDCHKGGLCIIVSDANTRARSLYERIGYREHATRPMVKERWDNPGSNWVLLLKDA